MKNFAQLKKEINLTDAFENELGLMYIENNSSSEDIRVVRHFYKDDLLPIYVDLYSYIVDRVKNFLSDYVIVPELVGFGKDFIIRSWFVYYISISRYFDEDESIEPPIEFLEMKKKLELIDLSSNKNKILKNVLYKTLLGSTGKTYFDSQLGKFVVAEPKISIKNLLYWQALEKESTPTDV